MKRFSAQYIITNSGPVLKKAIINTEDDGRIISIEQKGDKFKEVHSTEFHNGIIIPGFVNCHCHLELSHMKGIIRQGEGLSSFIGQVRTTRTSGGESILPAAYSADMEMQKRGVVLCADICNTSDTFSLKTGSTIKYLNLIEIFGIDPEKADVRMTEAKEVSFRARELNLQSSLVPHSLYSMSLPLLRLLKNETRNNRVTSIHFMETSAEMEFLENQSGPLAESYIKSGLMPRSLNIVRDHSGGVLNEITSSGNLILVHDTFADAEILRKVRKRRNLFFCLCPNSNLYIEKKLPPVNLLTNEGCEIVIGTDSLASNNRLGILEEIVTLQQNFPYLSIEDLVSWATINGARALDEEKEFGSIEPGKKPGLLLLENVDLQNMKLTGESSLKRLV
jgi:aminodeoxyfutalosine deaminase